MDTRGGEGEDLWSIGLSEVDARSLHSRSAE